MDNVQHKNLAAGRWFEMTFAEQMGNIGSEVGRAVSWQKKGNNDHKEKALERAFELIDLTVSDPRWIHRLKEPLRAREALADFFYGDNFYQSTGESLEKYFMQFAFEARRNH